MSEQSTMDELFAIMKIAKTQQEAVQAAIQGLEAERAAIAKERAALAQAVASVNGAAGEVRQVAMAVVPAIQKAAGPAIDGAVRESMAGVSDEAASALGAATRPIVGQLSAVVTAAGEAEGKLSRSMASFGWKWAALAGGATAGGICAVLIAAWLMVWWQRSQVERLDAQKADLESTVAELRDNVAALAKKGGRIKLNTCSDSAGIGRLCIPVSSNQGKGYANYTAPFSNAKTGQQFVIPEGY